MKILLLCWRDTAHPQAGGSERYLEHVGGYLAQLGHEVYLRTAASRGHPATQTIDGVVHHRYGGKFTVYPRAFLAMLAGRMGLGPYRHTDVVVDTQNGIPFFAVWAMGQPTIVLTHHCHREQWPVAGRVLAAVGWFIESVLSPRVNRHCDYVTVSGPSAEELVALGVDARRIHIIRNGVDPIPEGLPVTRKDGACRPVHLVCLSRLVPHKQIEHAMDVVAALSATRPVVLDVIGSGWWEENLHAYARQLGVADNVVFHGQVSEEDKHALLAAADLHVMPSRKEGWGLAVIEAACHGLPTVGYRCSAGLNDSVVDGVTGVLVDSKAELIAEISRLIDDPAAVDALGGKAKARAAGYSWVDTGRRFAQLIDTVAAPASRR
ncbi:glycosyltransferase family 4 protein [Corynebacterium mendelii]|uniref:Glycosyltransferase family 4 protein n=1 Tax=Corynebacterium mendelii TaxID=2765362 RepID=A0A939IY71_9CORY|nr:glycosyltransferase family 4 protein [Corynebacterium mendelii]MBN9645230.1 glycosyltransferase family 4 protein [Corynebacterium mendelii]